MTATSFTSACLRAKLNSALYSTIKFSYLTNTHLDIQFANYAAQALARYFSEGVGASLPKFLPFMCLEEGTRIIHKKRRKQFKYLI